MRLVAGALVAVLLVAPRTAGAQSGASTSSTPRIFVDVNLVGGTNSLASERTFTSLFAKFGEVGSMRSIYPAPSHANKVLVELGAGVILLPSFGVGAVYSRTTHENAVDLEATIPHPTFLRSSAEAAGVTNEKLERRESATHFFLAWVPALGDRTELRLSAGPSIFRYRADMVSDVLYSQAFNPLTPQNNVTIDGIRTSETTSLGAGFNVGGDVAYFLTRSFGVTAGVRFSYGTVTVDREPLSGLQQKFRVGSTLGFAGVRVRFGG
jgi:hypothetical protein